MDGKLPVHQKVTQALLLARQLGIKEKKNGKSTGNCFRLQHRSRAQDTGFPESRVEVAPYLASFHKNIRAQIWTPNSRALIVRTPIKDTLQFLETGVWEHKNIIPCTKPNHSKLSRISTLKEPPNPFKSTNSIFGTVEAEPRNSLEGLRAPDRHLWIFGVVLITTILKWIYKTWDK